MHKPTNMKRELQVYTSPSSVLHPPLQQLGVIHLHVVFTPTLGRDFRPATLLCQGWRGTGEALYRHPYTLVQEIPSEDYHEKNSCWFQVDSILSLMPSYFSFLYEIRKVDKSWHCFNHYCPFISFGIATHSYKEELVWLPMLDCFCCQRPWKQELHCSLCFKQFFNS